MLEGRLVDRYKRFFADVRLRNGHLVVTHCANPGSMKTCRPDGARVWVSKASNPKRKLRYTWELVQVDQEIVCVNPMRANDLVAEAIGAGVVKELQGYTELRREVRCGDSRIDILLTRGDERCFVEVKSVTLDVGRRVSAFPDSVTERGTRHLCELMKVVAAGDRAVMVFSCNRSEVQRMRPADEIDPTYGKTLREAAAAGVELLAYRSEISPKGMWLRKRIPVEL